MALVDRSCDVVVVGAGLSGLYAARALARAGVDVVVLEGRRRVGGRVWTERSGFGADLDHGAGWLGVGQDRVAALATELGVATTPGTVPGMVAEWRDGRRHTYTGLVPTSDAAGVSGAIEGIFEFDLAAYTFSEERARARTVAAGLDQQTLGSWLEQSVPSPSARSFLATVFTGIFGAEPEELSHLFAVFVLHGGGGLMNAVRGANGAHHRRFVGGAQRLADAMAAELGDRIVLDAPVTAVTHGGGDVTLTCVRSVDETMRELLGPLELAPPRSTEARPWRIRAARAVVAVPPVLAARIAWDPAVPTARQQATQRVPMGTVSTVHCVFHRPFWRDDGLSGQLVADDGLVRLAYDTSPADGSCGVVTGYVCGSAGRAFDGASPADRRRRVVEDVARVLGPAGSQPLEVVVRDWSADPFSAGGPMGVMGPGVLSGHAAALQRPMGLVHWAGAESATEWYGTMDGALAAGARAAAEVLQALAAVPPAAVGAVEEPGSVVAGAGEEPGSAVAGTGEEPGSVVAGAGEEPGSAVVPGPSDPLGSGASPQDG